MKKRLLWLLILAPLGIALLAVTAYFLVDAWLESAGGRRALEAALGERLGVPVSLAGEFSVTLLPEVGVEGTELFIGEPGETTEVAYAREFAVALAPRPLLDKQLLVESVYLAGGRFYPERWPAGESDAPGGGIAPPEIRALEVEDIHVMTGPSDGVALQLLRVDDFRVGAKTPFELAVTGYGALAGRFRWDAADASLALSGEWTGLLPGRTSLEARAGFSDGAGSVSLRRAGEGAAPGERLAIRFAYAMEGGPEGQPDGNGVRIDSLRLEAGDQFVEGAGCIRFGTPPRLDLELRAPTLDLDRLPDFGPLVDALDAGTGQAAEAPDATGPGITLNLRLRAGEARGQGAVAYDAMFLLGDEPQCQAPSAAAQGGGMTAVPVTVQ